MAPFEPNPGQGRIAAVLVAGRYELHEILGRGSMGIVYSGRDRVLDRPIALKLFPADSSDVERAARYEQEARLLARLNHPSLVTVYDVGIDATDEDGPKPYLVMQLVDGHTLRERIKRGPLSVAEVTALTTQLSSALAHIHERGIVHRDVKPANILLTPGDGGAATLTDFGIARLIDGARMTSTGFTLGTANYLSPEQLGGQSVGPPSDIYSLGLVLLECLTGEVAYPGYGVEAALPRLQRPPAIPDSVPMPWAGLLREMTDPRQDARPSAADVWRTAVGMAEVPVDVAETRLLPAVPASSGTQLLPTGTASSTAPSGVPRRVRRLWLLVAAMVALVVFVTVLAVATGGNGDGGGAAPTPGPTYPLVPGQLGSHLQQLQGDVAP
jgi:serine/threonine protein kinase